jgi:hypothetical protein
LVSIRRTYRYLSWWICSISTRSSGVRGRVMRPSSSTSSATAPAVAEDATP